mmetsp:Transcript_34227/g.50322  ORF Transcript_34227/g.50322 Transcript_34227/m.50322 type:complete len:94 (-) Transcript_34227:101-382(-)
MSGPNFFETLKMKTQIVAIDTEISILSDQIIAAKREFGDKTFDLMANLEANQAQISAYYDIAFKKVQPRMAKIEAKYEEKLALNNKLKPKEAL